MKAIKLLKEVLTKLEKHRHLALLGAKVSMAINELEEIKNRSCENCKHYEYDMISAIVLCYNTDNNQEYLKDNLMQVTSDFCCNKWESK